VIRVYDKSGHVIETHEHKGEFKEWVSAVRLVNLTGAAGARQDARHEITTLSPNSFRRDVDLADGRMRD
jgi:hypothetical protein